MPWSCWSLATGEIPWKRFLRRKEEEEKAPWSGRGMELCKMLQFSRAVREWVPAGGGGWGCKGSPIPPWQSPAGATHPSLSPGRFCHLQQSPRWCFGSFGFKFSVPLSSRRQQSCACSLGEVGMAIPEHSCSIGSLYAIKKQLVLGLVSSARGWMSAKGSGPCLQEMPAMNW